MLVSGKFLVTDMFVNSSEPIGASGIVLKGRVRGIYKRVLCELTHKRYLLQICMKLLTGSLGTVLPSLPPQLLTKAKAISHLRFLPQ